MQGEGRRSHVSNRIAPTSSQPLTREAEDREAEDVHQQRRSSGNVYEYECEIPNDVSPGLIIGTGGRNLRDIQEKGVDVHVSDEGSIYVKSYDAQTFNQAKTRIRRLLAKIATKRKETPMESHELSGSASPTDDG